MLKICIIELLISHTYTHIYIFFFYHFYSIVSVKPLSVKILTKPTILETEKDYSITCETTGSHPQARITWMEGNAIYHNGKVYIDDLLQIYKMYIHISSFADDSIM